MDSFWFSSSQILFGLFFQPISTHAQKYRGRVNASTPSPLRQLYPEVKDTKVDGQSLLLGDSSAQET